MDVAGVAWVVFELVTLLAFGVPAAVAAAASVVGALEYAVHRRLRVPSWPSPPPASSAMLPGLAVYRALYLMMEDSAALVGSALIELGSAVAIGLALAAGLSIGGYLARRRFGPDAAALRATRRSRGHYR